MTCLLVIFPVGCGDIASDLSSIEVSPVNSTVGINQAKAFTANGRSSGGTLVNIAVVWSVSSATVGSINASSGILTAGTAEATGYVVATSGEVSGRVAVTITAKGWLTGNVTDSNGTPINGRKIYLKQSPTLYDSATNLGNYRISSIPTGTYEVRVDTFGSTSAASAEVYIPRGATVTQNLTPYTPPLPVTTTTLPPF